MYERGNTKNFPSYHTFESMTLSEPGFSAPAHVVHALDQELEYCFTFYYGIAQIVQLMSLVAAGTHILTGLEYGC